MPDDLVDAFLIAQEAFSERVQAVAEDQWKLDTPDIEWSVADLVAHLIDEHRWAPPLLHGLDMDAAAKVVDGARQYSADGGIGANYAEAWDEAAVGSADAFTADGALEREVLLARGQTPAETYINEMIFDLVVHAWDLGRAIGYQGGLPSRVVDMAWAQAEKFGDLSASGMFDGPVSVPDDSPTIDRLVAMTGRDPR
jgi:uncharacterized protein (TIGR03086 family)